MASLFKRDGAGASRVWGHHVVIVGGGLALGLFVLLLVVPHLTHAAKGDLAVGTVTVDGPAEGTRLLPGDIIIGHATGDGRVFVWVRGVNVQVPVTMAGSNWQYTYAGGLDGTVELVFALEKAGKWGPQTEREYVFGSPAPRSPDLPTVFKPVDGTVKSVTAFVSAAISRVGQWFGGDVNHNSVPDSFESKILGIPYGALILSILAVLGLVGGLYAWRARDIHEFFLRRRALKGQERDMVARSKREELEVRVKAAKQEAAFKENQLRQVGTIERERVRVEASVARERARLERRGQ